MQMVKKRINQSYAKQVQQTKQQQQQQLGYSVSNNGDGFSDAYGPNNGKKRGRKKKLPLVCPFKSENEVNDMLVKLWFQYEGHCEFKLVRIHYVYIRVNVVECV